MANRVAHMAVAGALAAVALWLKEAQRERQSLKPIGGSALVAFCANIPDLLEPADHPHHRQFFHSLAFAAAVAVGMRELSNWNPETESEKLLRFGLLCAGTGILIHLAMDALTPRSLPLLGKI